MADVFNMHEAKTHLSAIVERVLEGERITIARAGKPVVDLVPHEANRVIIGYGRGEFDYCPEVFDGIDDEIQRMFYGDSA